MARKKTITRDQILNSAYELIKKDGFSHFTARNIAKEIGCSTQPIYLEFENMHDLKEVLFDKIFVYLAQEVFIVEQRDNDGNILDPIVNLGLNYIEFAKKEPKLYNVVYVESTGSGERIKNFSKGIFFPLIKKSEKYSEYNNSEINSLFTGMWIIATGVANLVASGTINPDRDQTIQILEDGISALIRKNDPLPLEIVF